MLHLSMKRPFYTTLAIFICAAFFWIGVATQASQQQPNVEIRRLSGPVTTAAQVLTGEEIARVCRARDRSARTKQL